VCTQFLSIDLSGFTIQQTKLMGKYNRLLIELGERPYNSIGANLPVEIRLIGFILLQAGIFYLGKVISSKFGSTVSDLFKGITGQPPEPRRQPEDNSQRPKRKMRGPRIKPEDIKNMSRDDE
jgi:hypothetical protein